MTAEQLCERSDLPPSGCAHCRDAGLYTPPSGAAGTGLNARDIDTGIALDIQPDGSVWASRQGKWYGEWIQAEEGMARGRFGRGRRHGAG